ncbi:hypothetical protein Ahy_A02g007842 [Arachis hypogaea]|uniref:RNA-binding S4 domain-containing protein n=1 Tax=Arachis hypogaea TaxID=3818 RepID=A0A445EE12_ARAHY|nr:hypothetical protein Ahy_A02g007842 [Arachis hypogaea]
MLVSAVKCGRVQVDGERVPVSYIVKSSQKISHFVHRGSFFAASQLLHISYQSSWTRELPQELLQLGVGAICPDDPIPSVEDLADQIVEILNYFGAGTRRYQS